MMAVLFIEDDTLNVDLYGDKDDIDVTKYVDMAGEVEKGEEGMNEATIDNGGYLLFGGNPDMIIAEMLNYSDYSIRINLEGNHLSKGSSDVYLGEFFRLIWKNDFRLVQDSR